MELLNGWAVSSGTGHGNGDSFTQSASMGDDAGLTKGVSGSGPGDVTGTLQTSANGLTSSDVCAFRGSAVRHMSFRFLRRTSPSTRTLYHRGATSLRHSFLVDEAKFRR